MPELPEVESIKIQLAKYLVGHVILGVDINYSKRFEGNKNLIIGGKITSVKRWGKVLEICLENGYSIIIHVKLTGQPIYRGPNLKNPPELSKKVIGGVPGKHTHVIFNLDRGGKLYYNDYRKFGWIKIVKTEGSKDDKYLKNLGPEPFGKLTLSEFSRILGKTTRMIKVLLMDQTAISGVGNIYANDALFLAKIDPQRKSKSLNKNEVESLYEAILKVLKKGIELGGASELSFVTPDGTEGKYQGYTLVYDREGEKCPNDCGGKIVKIKISGRGTYFCPNCQK